MFFDDASTKKLNLTPKLRLAGEGRENSTTLSQSSNPAVSARDRLLLARHNNATTPSILDRIDAISNSQQTDEEERDIARRSEIVNSVDDDWEQDVAQAAKSSKLNTGAQLSEMPQEQTAPAQEAAWSQGSTWSQESAWSQDQGSAAPLVHPVYVFNAIRKWRYAIATTTILGGLLGLGVALTTPKLYSSTASILIDPRNYKVVENDINPDVFLSEASLAIVDSQLNIIRSPAVVDKVVTQLKLEKDSEFNGTKKGIFSSITEFAGIISGSTSESSYIDAAIKKLNNNTNADRQPGTFIINISATSERAEMAAQIANTIVDVYMNERATDRTSTAKRTTSSMQSRLPDLKKQVELAEIKVAKFKAENDLFDPQGRSIDDEEILRLNDQLSGARSNTISLNARASTAKSVTVDGLLSGGLPEEISSNTLTTLRGQFSSAMQKYDGLQAKLGPAHPDLVQAGQEVASLKGSIEAEIKRVRTSLQTELRRAVQTEQSLAARLAQLKVKLAESGDASVTLREIEREAASARTVYEQFLLRAQETSEQGTIDSTNIKQTNFAKPSQDAVGTSRKLILIGGLIGGFIFGLGLAILKGVFDALSLQYGQSMGQSFNGRPNGQVGGQVGGQVDGQVSGPAGGPVGGPVNPSPKSRKPIRGTFAASSDHRGTDTIQNRPATIELARQFPARSVGADPIAVAPQPQTPLPSQPQLQVQTSAQLQGHVPQMPVQMFAQPPQSLVPSQPQFQVPMSAHPQGYAPQMQVPMFAPQPQPQMLAPMFVQPHSYIPQMHAPMFTPQMQTTMYAPHPTVPASHMHPQWYSAPPVSMAQPMMMPQMMAQQNEWPQPTPAVEPIAVAPTANVKKLPERTSLDDISNSLADIRAEILNLARQRRHG